MYPARNDPKNVRYVLWKWGVYHMDLDTATHTMIGDPGRDRLVVGKTRRELERRFGALRRPKEATPYLQACYEHSPGTATRRYSPGMVRGWWCSKGGRRLLSHS